MSVTSLPSPTWFLPLFPHSVVCLDSLPSFTLFLSRISLFPSYLRDLSLFFILFFTYWNPCSASTRFIFLIFHSLAYLFIPQFLYAFFSYFSLLPFSLFPSLPPSYLASLYRTAWYCLGSYVWRSCSTALLTTMLLAHTLPFVLRHRKRGLTEFSLNIISTQWYCFLKKWIQGTESKVYMWVNVNWN